MKVHFIQQDPWVTPGEYLCWAERNGWVVTCTRCWLREAVPEDAEADLLVVLGGHQNPATTEIYLHAEERDKDQSELQIYNELFGVSRELSQREKLQEILAKLSDDQIEELAPIVTRFYENL